MKKRSLFLLVLILILPLASAVEIGEIFTIQKDKPIIEKEDKTTTYFYAGSKLIASKNNNEIKYQYQDRLNSDINTKTLPFGQEINSDERFSFTGKELDNSGLYYFNARYYDSNIGRFTSIDPIKENHAYSYVSNNPMNYVDPSGMDEVTLAKSIEMPMRFKHDLTPRYSSVLDVGGRRFYISFTNPENLLRIKTLFGELNQWSGGRLIKETQARAIHFDYSENIYSYVTGDIGVESLKSVSHELAHGTPSNIAYMRNHLFWGEYHASRVQGLFAKRMSTKYGVNFFTDASRAAIKGKYAYFFDYFAGANYIEVNQLDLADTVVKVFGTGAKKVAKTVPLIGWGLAGMYLFQGNYAQAAEEASYELLGPLEFVEMTRQGAISAHRNEQEMRTTDEGNAWADRFHESISKW